MSETTRFVIVATCLAILAVAWAAGRWWAMSERRRLDQKRNTPPR
jgi:hypothetical protein